MVKLEKFCYHIKYIVHTAKSQRRQRSKSFTDYVTKNAQRFRKLICLHLPRLFHEDFSPIYGARTKLTCMVTKDVFAYIYMYISLNIDNKLALAIAWVPLKKSCKKLFSSPVIVQWLLFLSWLSHGESFPLRDIRTSSPVLPADHPAHRKCQLEQLVSGVMNG